MLDFREHHAHITKDVRNLATALSKKKLSPTYKTLVVEQLMKSKYHATNQGVFTIANLPPSMEYSTQLCDNPLDYFQSSLHKVSNAHADSRKRAYGYPPSETYPIKWG